MFEELISAGSPPVIGPAIEPVTVAQLAAFGRFDVPANDSAEFDLVDSFTKAAREQFEYDTRFALITQTWRLSLDRFPGFPINSTGVSELLPSVPYYMPFYEPSFYQVDPSNSSIDLLRGPVQAVLSIKYIDPLGVEQTFDPASYTLFNNVINLKPGFFWPTCQPIPNCVRVEYTTGFGDDATTVPNRAKTAIKFLANHWYENRSLVALSPTSEVAHTWRRMLTGFRTLYVPR